MHGVSVQRGVTTTLNFDLKFHGVTFKDLQEALDTPAVQGWNMSKWANGTRGLPGFWELVAANTAKNASSWPANGNHELTPSESRRAAPLFDALLAKRRPLEFAGRMSATGLSMIPTEPYPFVRVLSIQFHNGSTLSIADQSAAPNAQVAASATGLTTRVGTSDIQPLRLVNEDADAQAEASAPTASDVSALMEKIKASALSGGRRLGSRRRLRASDANRADEADSDLELPSSINIGYVNAWNPPPVPSSTPSAPPSSHPSPVPSPTPATTTPTPTPAPTPALPVCPASVVTSDDCQSFCPASTTITRGDADARGVTCTCNGVVSCGPEVPGASGKVPGASGKAPGASGTKTSEGSATPDGRSSSALGGGAITGIVLLCLCGVGLVVFVGMRRRGAQGSDSLTS